MHFRFIKVVIPILLALLSSSYYVSQALADRNITLGPACYVRMSCAPDACHSMGAKAPMDFFDNGVKYTIDLATGLPAAEGGRPLDATQWKKILECAKARNALLSVFKSLEKIGIISPLMPSVEVAASLSCKAARRALAQRLAANATKCLCGVTCAAAMIVLEGSALGNDDFLTCGDYAPLARALFEAKTQLAELQCRRLYIEKQKCQYLTPDTCQALLKIIDDQIERERNTISRLEGEIARIRDRVIGPGLPCLDGLATAEVPSSTFCDAEGNDKPDTSDDPITNCDGSTASDPTDRLPKCGSMDGKDCPTITYIEGPVCANTESPLGQPE
jgi:hypothetical protein